MKKFNIAALLSLTLALGFSSCQNDEYVEPEFKTKSFGVYASFFDHSNGGANINPTLINTNKVEGIKDISNGMLSHEWRFMRGGELLEDGSRDWTAIEKGEEVDFLRTNVGLGWESLEDYSEYLDPNIDPTNDLSDLTFLFNKGGVYKLVIQNVYDRNIRYMYDEYDEVLKTNITRYLESELREDGKYEVVREYDFEVFKPLEPAFKVYTDDTMSQEVDMSSKIILDEVECSEITINAGGSLYLHDATGEDEDGVSTFYTAPTTRKWTWFCTQAPSDYVGIPTATPFSSDAQDQLFTFENAGTYRVTLNVIRTKPDTYTTKFPTSAATETLPLVVYVL